MKCPYCRSTNTRVSHILHRETENKRYRRCQVCNASFVTVERLMNPRIEKAIERAESEEGE